MNAVISLCFILGVTLSCASGTLEGLQKRILGGQLATPGQFPYQVLLQLYKIDDGEAINFICGGALVSARTILTAAHCLDGTHSGVVRLGTTNLRLLETNTRISIPVNSAHFIIHDEYKRLIIENDMAIVNLPVRVQFNAGVQPIRLPKFGQKFQNAIGTISGFGKTSDSEPSSQRLRFVQRRILNQDYCKDKWWQFQPTQICIDGSDRKSPCPGDSGGPLVVREADGINTLVGLTSYGKQSCELGDPVVYSNVADFLDWIHQNAIEPIKV